MNSQLSRVGFLVNFLFGKELRIRGWEAMELRRLHDDANGGRRSGLGRLIHDRQQAEDENIMAQVVDLCE